MNDGVSDHYPGAGARAEDSSARKEASSVRIRSELRVRNARATSRAPDPGESL